MPTLTAVVIMSSMVVVWFAPIGVPHCPFQNVASSYKEVDGGIPSSTRRSELKEWSTGAGILDVVVATVCSRPIGSSTFWRSSVASGFPPILARMLPRIMKLVCA